jgi:hypothetical protein
LIADDTFGWERFGKGLRDVLLMESIRLMPRDMEPHVEEGLRLMVFEKVGLNWIFWILCGDGAELARERYQ